jgi:hypothetical protein
MGGVCWRGGSQEVARPSTITWFKMQDACILCNVIEILWWRKVTKTERGRLFSPFKLQMVMAQWCKNAFACLCKHPNISIVKGRNWSMWCWSWYLLFFVWVALKATNPWVVQDRGSRSTFVGLVITKLVNDALPTPWRIQMWVQIKNNKRLRNRGMLLSSQHFRRVEGRAGAPRWD